MKEIKVYVVNVEIQVYDEPLSEMSDEDFMAYAEEQGTIYTLKEFEDDFNNTPDNILSPEYDVIRFIEG